MNKGGEARGKIPRPLSESANGDHMEQSYAVDVNSIV